MSVDQKIVYMNKSYQILEAEQEFMIHPAAFSLFPITKASLQSAYSCEFHIEDYRLILDRIVVTDATSEEEQQKEIAGRIISYNGVILLGANLVKEYFLKGGKLTCFSYQNVFELVFENGMLITTIDQSKAMLRIRKNIELGLRNLNYKRDLRCIKRFINSSFVGDYKPFLFDAMRIKYLKEMQKEYNK